MGTEVGMEMIQRGGLQVCNNNLNIEFSNLSYTLPTRTAKATRGFLKDKRYILTGNDETEKRILWNLNGKFQSGHLVAILGPSGAGKTSLLNVLSGFKKTGVSGSITINGQPRNLQQFRSQSCYIAQEFAMLALLTTKETLMVAANLKLSPKLGAMKKADMVNGILEILGLQNAKDTYVEKLSGGEKKRLSIGVELLTNPPVMFFDEPTSGLDSSASLQVVTHLKSLAQGGRTIICTIHQPSSKLFELFDDLYILAEGRCCYRGTVQDMAGVFEEAGFSCPKYYNRADFAIEVVCKERGPGIEKLLERFAGDQNSVPDNIVCLETDATEETASMLKAEILNKEIEEELRVVVKDVYEDILPQYPVPGWKQFLILVQRAMLCGLRDLYVAQIRFVMHLVVGLMLGIICYNFGQEASKAPSNAACIFFFILFLFLLSPLLTVLIFPMEASVFFREHLNNWYSLHAYYFSKLLSDLPLQILCPSVFVLGSYFLTGQPYDGFRLPKFWALCILLAAIGQTMGFVAGAAFDAQLGLFAIIAFNVPTILFSGFYIRLDDMPSYLHWMTYFSYFRYAFEAGLLVVYGDNREDLHCSEAFCRYKYPTLILKDYGMENSSFELDMVALLIWLVATQLAFFLVLKWRLYRFR